MRSALLRVASKRLSEEELPIKRLWDYREKLSAAVDETRWDEAESLARAIMKDIKPAMDRLMICFVFMVLPPGYVNVFGYYCLLFFWTLGPCKMLKPKMWFRKNDLK